jgi:hypothetical protein
VTEQPVSEGGERQSRGTESAAKRATFHRYRVALVLFILAVAFGVTAKAVLPSSSPVFVHGAIQRITVTGNLTVSGVDLNETPLPGGTGVTLEVTLRSPQPQLRTSLERLVIAVPDSSKSGDPCPKGALSCRPPVSGVRTIYVRFPDREWTNAGTSGASPYRFELPVRIDLPGVESNLVQDDQDVAAALPPVSVLQQTADSTTAPTYESSVVVSYSQSVSNGGSYTWSDTAVAPVTIGGLEVWSYLAVTSVPAALSPQLDSGTDLAVEGHNSNAVFLAGALLGIAGGALVGAGTEAIKA